MTNIMDVLRECGCLSYIDKGFDTALKKIESSEPEGLAMLSEDAVKCLRENYRERMDLIYSQVLTDEVRGKLAKYDPVGLMLGRFDEKALRAASGDLMTQTEGCVEEYLHEKYPLLKEYQKLLHDHYIGCFSEFLQAFVSKKEELSRKLLGGNSICTILKLSTSGADIHRNGRCVIGVTTDAGAVYYKPHDCSLDVLYHEIVEKWFSDCAVAADVVEGTLSSGRFAFVSCLKHEPVSCEKDIAEYYYNFGILTALFHGLGSNDMHYENIFSCGTKPAAIDMETVLGTAVKNAPDEKEAQSISTRKEISNSLFRTCILPIRTYRGPLVSPLYGNRENAVWLPEYKERYYSVEGHEKDYSEGFKEGYQRMLEHRDEIFALADRYRNATVRCLLRNTSFYFLIRNMIFSPERLKDEKGRDTAFAKLCSPYTAYGAEPEKKITQYEWQCLLKGDIPYYCTTVDGRDLCGESPDQTVEKDYYRESILESVKQFLGRLSPDEEAFEQDLLRVIFFHAPTDENPDEPEALSDDAVPADRIKEETAALFEGLKKDAIRCSDGSLIWISTAESLKMTESAGDLAMLGNIGLFSARIAASGLFHNFNEDAVNLAETMCSRMEQTMDFFEEVGIKEDKLYTMLPTGLQTGLGLALAACSEMAKAGVSNACELSERIIRFSLEHRLYLYKKINAAEGTAGMLLALSLLPRTPDAEKLARASAEKIAEEELPDRADFPFGSAGIGAAFAAAYEICKDPRYIQGALTAFGKVLDEYKPELSGWPDGNAKLKWMADKGPHAAGIYLAAAFAKDKLADVSKEAGSLTEQVCGAALGSMLKEETLLRLDSLKEGNALTVLALLKAGKKDAAGRILSAMIKRKDRKGFFTVTPNGVRSSYDPSWFLGSTGISLALMEYISK